jgi:hypothetical protein
VIPLDDVFHTHQQPAWRDRSNFILMAALPEAGRYEQLWARQQSDTLFEVCCIPFFVYNLSLGDVVRTEASGERAYVVAEVVQPSGRWTFRVWLGGSTEDPAGVETELVSMGALTEWSSRNLLAVDAANAALAQRLADALADGEREGRWVYETGRV